MKKLVLLSVLAAFTAAGAFAISAGAGGYFTSDFGGGAESSLVSVKTPYAGGGGFAFLDLTYAELSFGFFGGGGTSKMKITIPGVTIGGVSIVEPTEVKTEGKTSISGLDIGLLGKFPIAIGKKLSVFPLLGITYRVVLSENDKDGKKVKNFAGKEIDPGDFSALWFKGGAGLDVSLTDKLYLRGGLLYGLRAANKFENDLLDTKAANIILLGHGLDATLAVGYRF
jgi:hypothetical protein